MWDDTDSVWRTKEYLLDATLTYPQPGTVMCTVTGEVDGFTVDVLAEKLIDACNLQPVHLIVDLSRVDFISSAGLKILVEAHARQNAARHDMVLVPNSRVNMVLQMIGLDHEFRIYDDPRAALNACRN